MKSNTYLLFPRPPPPPRTPPPNRVDGFGPGFNQLTYVRKLPAPHYGPFGNQ